MKKINLILLALSTLLLVACEDESIIDPVPPKSLQEVLLNNESDGDALDYWTCEDPAFPGTVTDFAFFSDYTGLLRDTSQTIAMTYVISEQVVDISIDGGYAIRLMDFSVADSEEAFGVSYLFSDAATSGTMSCRLAGAFFDQNIFANANDGEKTADAWQCAVGDDIPVLFALGENGLGVFFNPEYPGGVTFTWTADAQGIYLTLGDGASVIALNARLNNLQLIADAFLIDGVNAGFMFCELVEI